MIRSVLQKLQTSRDRSQKNAHFC